MQPAPAPAPPPPATRELTSAEVSAYARDGFVIVRGLFSSAEADVLRTTIARDGVMEGKVMAMQDGTGRSARLSLWHTVQPRTCYGALAASRRMVHAVRRLLSNVGGGESPYHIHTKIILKEPRTGALFQPHSDFGYWYQCGTLNPHSMMSVVVAVDAADAENGCLQVLAGSHALGRLEHGHAGEQAGAEPEAFELARARLPTVVCALAPGDVLFTHSNLLHWSGPNTSDRWRRAIIVAFNDASNPPTERGRGLIPMPHALEEVDDARLLEVGPAGFDTEAGCAEATTWLSHEKNVETFRRGGDFSEAAVKFAARADVAGAAPASEPAARGK